jgi:hypothetical protein
VEAVRRVAGLLVALLVATSACGGKIGEGGDGGIDGSGVDGSSVTCCPPSAQPGCCMSFGGAAQGNACTKVCDGMPSPGDPGWHLSTDSDGCKVWIPPSSPTSTCGEPPPPPLDAGTGCSPQPITQWSPQIDPPFFAHANVCTLQALQDIYVNCFAGQSTSMCQSVMQQNATCASCLLTPSSASKWGALLEMSNGIVELDIAGCIADASGNLSCAQAQSNITQCEEQSCASCMPVDAQSFQEYSQCLQASGSTTCAKYVAAQCANQDAGSTAQCFPSDFKDGFFTFGALFCGQ